MCQVSINIDEVALRDMRPDLDSKVAIRLWAQQVIDLCIQKMRNGDNALLGNRMSEEAFDAIERRIKNRQTTDMPVSTDYAIDLETMRERLHRMVHEVYSMP